MDDGVSRAATESSWILEGVLCSRLSGPIQLHIRLVWHSFPSLSSAVLIGFTYSLQDRGADLAVMVNSCTDLAKVTTVFHMRLH